MEQRYAPTEAQVLLQGEAVIPYDHQEEEMRPLEAVEAQELFQGIMEALEAAKIIEAIQREVHQGIAEVQESAEAIAAHEEVPQDIDVPETVLEVVATEVHLPEVQIAVLPLDQEAEGVVAVATGDLPEAPVEVAPYVLQAEAVLFGLQAAEAVQDLRADHPLEVVEEDDNLI